MNAGRKIRTRKPRCYMIYAMAPEGIKPAETNRMINEMVDEKIGTHCGIKNGPIMRDVI